MIVGSINPAADDPGSTEITYRCTECGATEIAIVKSCVLKKTDRGT